MTQKITYKEVEELFDNTDKSKDEIRILIEKKEKEIRTKRPKWKDEQVMKHLFKSFYTSRKRDRTDVGGIYLFLLPLWTTSSFNWVEGKITAIMEYIRKNGWKKARDDFYVNFKDEDLNYLKQYDSKPEDADKNRYTNLYYWEFKSGTTIKNQMFKHPLPDVSHIKSVGGIASRDGELFKPFVMTISGDFANPDHERYKKILLGKVFRVKCGLNKETNSEYELQAKGSTYFNEIPENFENFEVEEDDILSIYDKQRVTMDKVEAIFDKLDKTEYKHSTYSNEISVSKVLVIEIEDPIGNKKGVVYVDNPFERPSVNDKGEEVQPFICNWESTVPMNFGVDSEIIIWYKMAQYEIKEGDDWTEIYTPIQFNVVGCFVTEFVERKTDKLPNDQVESDGEFIPPDIEDIEEESEEDDLDLDDFENPEDILDDLFVDKEKPKKKKKSKSKKSQSKGDIQL
ncbi:MAG: hypothetical protein ACFFG0_07850 [Candidatus Thorarchaeota archaeon]